MLKKGASGVKQMLAMLNPYTAERRDVSGCTSPPTSRFPSALEMSLGLPPLDEGHQALGTSLGPREISWSSGMYNPTLSAVYGYNTLRLFKKRTAINMGLITHCSCKAWEFFTTIQPNLEQNIYISFMYVSDYFTKHGQSSIPSRRREESRWQRWCEAWLSRFQSWDLTELQKWILWSIRY